MITVFNRKELIITYDLKLHLKIRDILAVNGVDYRIINPLIFSTRYYAPVEYKIYVRRKDYERACYLVKDVI